jgi:hypothetical protein
LGPPGATDGEVLALCQDMTLSSDAFLRSLPAAVDHVPFRCANGVIRPDDPRERWHIVLTPIADIALGALTLPRQHVELYLHGYSDAQTRRFLERFELAFRRAGG